MSRPPRKSEPGLTRIKMKFHLSGLSSPDRAESSLEAERLLRSWDCVTSLSWEVKEDWMYVDIKLLRGFKTSAEFKVEVERRIKGQVFASLLVITAAEIA